MHLILLHTSNTEAPIFQHNSKKCRWQILEWVYRGDSKCITCSFKFQVDAFSNWAISVLLGFMLLFIAFTAISNTWRCKAMNFVLGKSSAEFWFFTRWAYICTTSITSQTETYEQSCFVMLLAAPGKRPCQWMHHAMQYTDEKRCNKI